MTRKIIVTILLGLLLGWLLHKTPPKPWAPKPLPPRMVKGIVRV